MNHPPFIPLRQKFRLQVTWLAIAWTAIVVTVLLVLRLTTGT